MNPVSIIFTIVAIAAIAAGVYFLVIKKKTTASSGTTTGTVYPTGWSIIDSKENDGQLKQDSNGNYYFDFPPSGTGIHYVVENAPSLQLGQTVTLSFNVSGDGTVVPVQGDPPAEVSLIIQHRNDNLSGTGIYQQYRYFHFSAQLVNGDGILSATLTPDQWSDVMGKPGTDYPNQFANCIANAAYIGFVFGKPAVGASGHGAYVVNGQARFTLKSYTIA